MEKCRIVIDNYGVGSTLSRFLNFLKQQKAEVIVINNADKSYLEAKVASLISKRQREELIKKINENPEFQINNLSVGSGNPNDQKTIKWLEEWYSARKEWPWFVKKSYTTVKEIEGKITKTRKLTPPIREDLLSEEFIDEFNKGHLSIEALSLVCPNCGSIIKSVKYVIFEKEERKISGVKCPSCKKLIDDAGFTLRYYCGYILPDNNIIQRSLLSKDLDGPRFFEGFTIVIPPVIRKECDKGGGGKKELKKLAEFASMGRIKLEMPGKVEEVPDNSSSIQRDEIIVNAALEYNAILITADNPMKASSISKGVFTIFV